jgi:hypothetical protein
VNVPPAAPPLTPAPSESPLATGTTPATPAGPTGPPKPARGVRTPGRAAISAPHLRTDRWWLPPLVTALGLGLFVAYSTWRAFANAD